MADIEFLTNNYTAFLPEPRDTTKSPDTETEQGMTKTVRQTLEQYARSGQYLDTNRSKQSFAAEFDDKEPLNSERVNDLLEMPDLTGNSEMEIIDYIRDNTTEVDLSKVSKQTEPVPGETAPPGEPS